MIQVTVNKTTQSIPDKTSVTALLTLIEQSPKGIAVAINNAIVTKSAWDNHYLNPNDNILIIRATQGG